MRKELILSANTKYDHGANDLQTYYNRVSKETEEKFTKIKNTTKDDIQIAPDKAYQTLLNS